MMKVCIAAGVLFFLGLGAVLPSYAQTTGSKFFGCIEMQWQIPAGQSSVHIEFLKKGETFGRLFLDPQESFRQFSFAAESVYIEGRVRTVYDRETKKGVLRADSITYRCYSPSDRWFSGEIDEFDLPEASTE